ncbi:MAG: hypothetical protein AUI50_02515 [Crenarchaeota archaeon 13_1_40CM_2_52_14]|nr:MAG: hypothetical protein AUI97_03680 [Crenarchaeota archaeon 13_1_40CM_3_52_17]OLD35330.1 MAG: hypothetical protein AUI50_02515 [Crenarchaeota archaeon 13_1_40CM_2_52_14]
MLSGAMVQYIPDSKNCFDFLVQVSCSSRFTYGPAVNSDRSNDFDRWDLNLVDKNPVAPDGESILHQELSDLQPFRMSLKERLDSLPHRESLERSLLKNLKGSHSDVPAILELKRGVSMVIAVADGG